MRVLNEFLSSHHYFNNFKLSEDIYCPNCGLVGNVWIENEGDYYVGEDHICTDCKTIFTMPTKRKCDERELKIINQLLTGITDKPTTPKGR